MSSVGRLRDVVALLGDGSSCSACAHSVYSTFAPRAFRVSITRCALVCVYNLPLHPCRGVFCPIVTCFAAWTSTSVFASHDAKIVFRSAGMLGYPTGFRYKEVMRHKVRRRNQFCVESKSRFSTGRPRNQPTTTRSSLRMKYSRRSIS